MSPGTAAPAPKSGVVLVADDSPTLRRIVTTVLERAGYTVVTAEDGIQAVQQVFLVQPDAVVLDVQMPRLSGYVAARLLKDDWATAQIPIVVLTSLDAASDRYWGLQTGAARFLTKDFEAPELVAAVQEEIADSQDRRGGRPRVVPHPVEITADEVLARVSELLDRQLFEAALTAEVMALAAAVYGFEEIVTAVLGVLRRVVEHDVAAVALLDGDTAYATVANPCSQAQYGQFLDALARAVAQAGGTPDTPAKLPPQLADPHGWIDGDGEEAMGTFLSMPLRARGRVIGVLALSSAARGAFGSTALDTLRIVEGPAAVVVDSARLARRGIAG